MLKIAQKIKNGECPVLCFFGDSITDGQFEFANGHKESVRHEEWVFWNILRNRIREEIGQEVSIVNAGVGGNFSKDGLARIQQDVLERKPDFCCVMFGTNDVTNAYKGDSALQEYEKNMKQILIRLRESNIETVLMTPGMLCKHRVKGFWGFWWYIHRYFGGIFTDILKTCKRLGTWMPMLPKSERLPTNWIFRLQMHMPNGSSSNHRE